MTSVYKQLADVDLKLGKGESVLLSTEKLSQGRLKGIKATIIILFIFSLTAFVCAAMLYDMLNREKTAVKSLEASQVQLREKAQSYEDQIKGLSDQIADMSGGLQEITVERDALKARVEKGGTELTKLQEQVARLNQQKQFLEDKAKQLESKLGSLPGSSEAQPTAAAVSKEPRILTVNRQFNFVVVNLGSKDNLGAGAELSVERGGQEVGKVQVEKLYENFSAATITKEPQDAPLQEGDSVRRPF